jgi:hypothetical protein
MDEITEKQRKNLKNKIIDSIHKSDIEQIIMVGDFLGIRVPNSLRDWRVQMKENNRKFE